MEHYKFGLCLIIVIVKATNSAGCLQGITTIGYTTPKGDIVLEYGKSPLEIFCTVNDRNIIENISHPSTRLRFQENNTIVTENVSIINSTSIRLYDKHPKKQASTYTCVMEKENEPEIVCVNVVVVGTKPLEVDDFDCISENYENLTCSWTPKENFAKINYNLTYTFPPLASSRRSLNWCPQINSPDEHTKRMSCFWDQKSEPHYRQTQRIYNFNLTMSNKLGRTTTYHQFHHCERVIPAPPKNLVALNTTTNSVLLHWNITMEMMTFLESGLNYKVLYQCEYGPRDWELGGMSFIRSGVPDAPGDVYFNLTGLHHAHDLCDIRVSLKSNATDDIRMWSSNSSVTVRTSSTAPGTAPRTNIGSFELVEKGSRRDVYIYWAQLPEEIKNGEDFRYNVTIIGDSTGVKLNETTNAYAKFENLLPNLTYMFEIWAENAEGKSVDRSYITIPSKQTTPPEPNSIRKISYDQGVYELIWDAPKLNAMANQIRNYTVFWCSNVKDRPYQCSGHLNWIEIDGDVNKTRVTLNETDKNVWQFAVSANTDTYSSGMVWAACTILHNRYISKIRDVWTRDVQSKSVELAWKLECIDLIGNVDGFIIYYCPIVLRYNESICNGTEHNLTIHDPTKLFKKVEGLKPYTTYMFGVSVKTKRGDISERSDYKSATTMEAAPSRPSDLQVIDYTNSSIKLSWKPPAELNGAIKYYEVSYSNGEMKKIDKDIYNCTLDSLISYEFYNISVRACTTECSDAVNTAVTTRVGYPDVVRELRVHSQNESSIVVVWDKPSVPRGQLNFYEVHVKTQGNKTVGYYNVTEPNFLIQECKENEYNTFFLSIRAVNLLNDIRLDGTWSPELTTSCLNRQNIITYFIIAVAGVLLITLVSYVAKRLRNCCVEMKDVEVKLPPGLQPIDHWTIPKEDMENIQTADEELYPLQDSSGCSSGHASVISESGTNTITIASDSGTESNELRKRPRTNNLNVVIRAVPNNTGYVSMPSDSNSTWPKQNDSNYCKLGLNPEEQMDSDSIYDPVMPLESKFQYVSCDAITPPAPYVLTGEKPSNSGYIPLNYPEKNPAYVMAGTQSLLMPDIPLQNIVTPEEKPFYVQIADVGLNLSTWQKPPPVENKIASKGYISIGDALSNGTKRTAPSDAAKGYVPHRQFDATKLLKED